MAYCTKQDLWDRYGEAEITQASDSHDNDGVENTEAITAAINDATDLINQFLRLRFVLPLVCVPSSIKLICCEIARYLLHDNLPTEEITIRYQDAVKRLQMLRDRDMMLYDETCGDVFTELTSNQVVVKSRSQIYTPTIMGKIFP